LRQVLLDGKSVQGAQLQAGHAVAEVSWDAAGHEIEFQYGR